MRWSSSTKTLRAVEKKSEISLLMGDTDERAEYGDWAQYVGSRCASSELVMQKNSCYLLKSTNKYFDFFRTMMMMMMMMMIMIVMKLVMMQAHHSYKLCIAIVFHYEAVEYLVVL